MKEWTTVRRIVTFAGISVLGCASTLSQGASQIRWVDTPQQVADCASLGVVEGSSAQSGPANISTGRNNARNEALEHAAAKGATHVQWMENNEGWSGIYVTAAVFDCGRPERPRVVENRGDHNGDRTGDTHKRGVDERAKATTSSATKHPPGDADGPRKDVELAPVTPKAPTIVSTGTCFFVSPSGLALSSLHVVRGAQKILVIDAKGHRSTATVLAKDEPLDLVALQVDEESVPQVLPLAEDAADLGDHVFTIGFPEVGDLGVDPKLTEGSISGERGLGLDFLLQTSAPVQPGNSGGPLVNDTGRVVGIVALRQNYFSDGASASNTAFAVKASSVRKAFRSLSMAAGKPLRERKAAIARARDAACLVIAGDQSLPSP
jgi:S1-C subfamily serine protease